MFDQPINELLGHKAVWVSSQVVPSILDHLRLMEPQSGEMEHRKEFIKKKPLVCIHVNVSALTLTPLGSKKGVVGLIFSS